MSGILMGLITTLHILACVSLMVAILLQSGKGGGLAGTFGAGSSQTLFGGRGAATFLSRATTTLAVTFFVTSLTLGLNASRSSGTRRSLIQEEARRRGGAPQTAVPGGGTTTAPGPAATQGAPPASGPQAPPTPPASNPAPSSGSATQTPAGNGATTPATGGQ